MYARPNPKLCPDCGAWCAENSKRCWTCSIRARSKPREKVCPTCGKRWTVLLTRDATRKTCSPVCESEYRASLKRGKRNPQYKHGHSQKQSKRRHLGPTRWGLKLKGEEDCRACPNQASHLHHIVPRSRCPEAREDVEGNGLPLCAGCHRGWHDRRITVYREYLRPHEIEAAIARVGEAWMDRNYPLRNRDEEVALTKELGLEAAYKQAQHTLPDAS